MRGVSSINDVAKAAACLRSTLAEKLGLANAMFCAGTSSDHGKTELLRMFDIDPAGVRSVHHRGLAWPGLARSSRGTEFVERAAAAGCPTLEPMISALISLSQLELLRTRGAKGLIRQVSVYPWKPVPFRRRLAATKS